ncbi:MAG: PadR family transcriptional regulator [Leptolinea sp.]|jgi:DNA-binding PadR family transcriptional regulator|nr:PadR family transcriptional regulator [Leptolinea sp.]
MKTLSNLEFAILSLVAEKPVHGYQLEQLIIKRGMRSWTDIGFSSIYHVLRKLQGSNVLTCQNETPGDRPTRKRYSITPAGLALLHDETLLRLSAPQLCTGDFDLALGCLPLLTKEETNTALMANRERLVNQIKVVEQEKEKQASFTPPHVATLFDHTLYEMRSELNWISHFLRSKEIENGQ